MYATGPTILTRGESGTHIFQTFFYVIFVYVIDADVNLLQLHIRYYKVKHAA
jgi:hypothetical protein